MTFKVVLLNYAVHFSLSLFVHLRPGLTVHCSRPPLHSRHRGELQERHPRHRHQQDRAEHQVRARLLSSGERHGRGGPGDLGQLRPPEEHPGEGGPHRPVHHPDPVRLPVQHRGPRDQRERPAAERHHLLRRDGVHLHLQGAQRHRHLRRDLGPEQAPGQPGQHPRVDLPVQGDGQQLWAVPQSGREVPVWVVSGNKSATVFNLIYKLLQRKEETFDEKDFYSTLQLK